MQDLDAFDDQAGFGLAREIGATIRFARKQLKMTQAQLIRPDYSTGFLSLLERGHIRPSLHALSLIAQRLDVPLSFLLTGDPSVYEDARKAGYSYEDDGADPSYAVGVFQAAVLVLQGAYEAARQLLLSMRIENMDPVAVYHLHILRGRAYMGLARPEEAIVCFRTATAFALAQLINRTLLVEQARNQQGLAFAAMQRNLLALDEHLKCYEAIEQGRVDDPVFTLEVLGNIGRDYLEIGDFAQAQRFFQQALDHYGNMSSDDGKLAGLYMDVSLRLKRQGLYLLASEYAARSLIVYETGEGRKRTLALYRQLGDVLERLGDRVGAELAYARVRAIERTNSQGN